MASSTENNNRKGKGGPKTPEGKARSSMNALRHGACSEAVLLANESAENYDKLERSYYDHWRPATFQECELLDEMIVAKWRQRRCWNTESAAIDCQMERSAEEFLRHHNPGPDSSKEAAYAIRKLSNESNELQSLSRYETRYHRMYHRALARLIELQEKRILDGQSASAPAEEILPNELPDAPETPQRTQFPSFTPPVPLTLSNFSRPDIRAASA
jgi:hypothetical protein